MDESYAALAVKPIDMIKKNTQYNPKVTKTTIKYCHFTAINTGTVFKLVC